MTDNNSLAIIKAFEGGASMREIAKEHGISVSLVRRILIDSGVYANNVTIYAQRRLSEGETLDKIASELGITVKSVQSNLPYIKGRYNLPNATRNAKRIRAMRLRRKGMITNDSDDNS